MEKITIDKKSVLCATRYCFNIKFIEYSCRCLVILLIVIDSQLPKFIWPKPINLLFSYQIKKKKYNWCKWNDFHHMQKSLFWYLFASVSHNFCPLLIRSFRCLNSFFFTFKLFYKICHEMIQNSYVL